VLISCFHASSKDSAQQRNFRRESGTNVANLTLQTTQVIDMRVYPDTAHSECAK
jgi:hypothetical protein